MPAIKLTVVGAGSPFTFRIVSDLIRQPALRGSTIALVDVDTHKLDLSERIVHRMVAESGADLQIESSADRREVLPGSDFCLNSISVGEPWARERDVAIGERYGIYQPTSQTVGPAGFCRGLRVIPHVAAIARDVAALCPQATVIDLANPMAAVMRTLVREFQGPIVGLCHSWRLSLGVFASLLGVPENELDCVSVGTNHLTWALALYHQGRDVLPEFLRRLDGPQGEAVHKAHPVAWSIYRAFGLWSTSYDLHLAEFFPYFLTPETHGGADYGLVTRHTTPQEHKALWAERRALAQGTLPLGDLLAPSQEGVIEIMVSLLGIAPPSSHVVNLPNGGLVDNLPADMIIELPAYVSSGAVRGLQVGPFPQPVAQIMATRAVQQELLVDAALSGSRDLALQGLLLDPQIRSIDTARAILSESLDANAEWLPLFQ